MPDIKLTIDGGLGDDVIIGGAGAETMTGGAGNDTFVYRPGSGADVITDFTADSTDDRATISSRACAGPLTCTNGNCYGKTAWVGVQ